jgi:hypothetical protein
VVRLLKVWPDAGEGRIKNLVENRSAITMAAPIWQPNCPSRHKEMTIYQSMFSGTYLRVVAGLTFATEILLIPSKSSRTANSPSDLPYE